MRKCIASNEGAPQENKEAKKPFLGSIALDPTLTSLFSSSLGSVKAISKKSSKSQRLGTASDNGKTLEPSENGSAADKQEHKPNMQSIDTAILEISDSGTTNSAGNEVFSQRRQKRKREHGDEDLEERYMDHLNEQAAKEDKDRLRINHNGKWHAEQNTTTREDNSRSNITDVVTDDMKISSPTLIPQHESLATPIEEVEMEKASRTVFLANVSTTAIKSKSARAVLIDHMESFGPSPPLQKVTPKIESFRFRSTAFCSNGLPKKAAFIKKELMDATTKSTHAYAVYTTQLAAREAVKALNGSIILDRHLRVDSVAHPTKIDHRRCVFIGNIGFVDDESMMNAAKDTENGKPARKSREPADVEEGLWRQFSKAGVVESVRVVRDRTTRVGKGFAYVQFQNANGVEKALLFDKKRFPPMLPRTLRVTRAKHQTHPSSKNFTNTPNKSDALSKPLGKHRYEVSSENRTLSGRANKLFGRAGAAQLRSSGKGHRSLGKEPKRDFKSPESIVFEGYRASSQQGGGTMKTGRLGKQRGKPKTRSSRRGAAFKTSGKMKIAL